MRRSCTLQRRFRVGRGAGPTIMESEYYGSSRVDRFGHLGPFSQKDLKLSSDLWRGKDCLPR